jgi:hypothetical protein
MAADEMHQLHNETTGYRDRGESVSACVRDQRAALFHTQSRTTTYHVRWEEVAAAFGSVIKMMTSARAADENTALSHLSTNEVVLMNPMYLRQRDKGGLRLLH